LPKVKFLREVRLYHATKRVDVLLQLDKQVAVDYESLYVAFPFVMKHPEIWIENVGAIYRAGIDQLPGSATDWLSVGSYVSVTNSMFTITLVPHDTPVVQVGDINTGKWAKKLCIEKGRIFSWVMNNMWWTNFPAFQEGTAGFIWSLTVYDGPFDRKKSEEFAHDVRVGVCVGGAY